MVSYYLVLPGMKSLPPEIASVIAAMVVSIVVSSWTEVGGGSVSFVVEITFALDVSVFIGSVVKMVVASEGSESLGVVLIVSSSSVDVLSTVDEESSSSFGVVSW